MSLLEVEEVASTFKLKHFIVKQNYQMLINLKLSINNKPAI